MFFLSLTRNTNFSPDQVSLIAATLTSTNPAESPISLTLFAFKSVPSSPPLARKPTAVHRVLDNPSPSKTQILDSPCLLQKCEYNQNYLQALFRNGLVSFRKGEGYLSKHSALSPASLLYQSKFCKAWKLVLEILYLCLR